jgi:hypothetical protein
MSDMQINNTMTLSGATRLAKRIEQFWLDRGYAGIETTTGAEMGPKGKNGDQQSIYSVRSNIGPTGYPPQAARKVA